MEELIEQLIEQIKLFAQHSHNVQIQQKKRDEIMLEKLDKLIAIHKTQKKN